MPEPTHRRGRPVRRLLGVAAGALAVLVVTSTSPTLSAWTSGVVGNTPNTAAPASLAFSHLPAGGTACAQGVRTTGTATCVGSVLPTAASAGTPVTGTDAITNNGTASSASLSATVSAASCAPVRLDNARTAADVMLPRYGVAFRQADRWGGTNAVGLDGTGFAVNVAQDTMRTAGGGFGVWFRARPGQSGPLFSLDNGPAGTSGGTTDRTLVLNPNGTLTFFWSSNGTSAISSAAGTSYADNAWHFAYVALESGFLSRTQRLSVDGVEVTVGPTFSLTAYTGTTGYWHLGWAPTDFTDATVDTFPGLLSNFVVFGASVPTRPTAANLGSQSAFTTWAAGAVDHWLLGDNGTTPYAGSHPVINAANPCSYLNVTWSFTNPASTAVTSRSLAAFATGTSFPVGSAPGPGTTQTSSVAISRGTTWVNYLAGLRLHVPVTYRVQAGTTGTWSQSFVWSSVDSVVLG